MRSHREPLLSALAGLLVGIFATLSVVGFQETFRDKTQPTLVWERYGILTALLLLAVAAIAVYLKLARSSASESDAGAPEPEERRKDGPTLKVKESAAREAFDKDRRNEKEPARGDKPAPGSGRAPTPPPSRESRQPLPPPVREARNSARPVSDESPEPPAPPLAPVHSGRLVEIWDSYYKNGNGRFDINGLRRSLETGAVKADVLSGDQLAAGDNVLIVDLRDGSGQLHVLPNFTKPVRALEEWFQPLGSGDRTAIPQKLIRPATARRWGGSITLESKGEVA
jgi:hypothetical protein